RATKLSAIFGHGIGRAIYRDVTSGKTSFLPDTPVPNAVGYILNRGNNYKSYSGVRGAFVEKAQYTKGVGDEPDVAQFVFLAPRIIDPNGGSAPDAEIEAYGLSDDGKVVFAPDQGTEKDRFKSTFNKTNAAPTFKNAATGELNPDATVLCFPARGVAMFDTLDQRYFQVLTQLSVLDGQTDAIPTQYGFLSPLTAPGQGTIEPIAIVYGAPTLLDATTGRPIATHLKVIMAQGLLGKRLVLLNTQPSTGVFAGQIKPDGVGVDVPATDDPVSAVVPHLAYQVAQDLWQLNQKRIRLLKQFGISNQRVDALHGEVGCPPSGKVSGEFACPPQSNALPNGGVLQLAGAALGAKQFDRFYADSRRAFGLESRAYPDVEATSQDVLKGILFYLALLIPFSFFLERLLFGFPDIRKQIMGTGGIFLLVFVLISQVHPAFQLASAPFIILLAFIILALTVVVTGFLSSKFEEEIKRMKQGVHFADVGRISAIGAALGLGVANMRRRPTRTALTCVTLILLTFTVLSFTSVTAGISNFARVYSTRTPSYTGVMVRQPDWGAMDEAAVTSMRNEFTQRFGPVALRAWYLSRDPNELLQLRVANGANSAQFFHAPALMGVTPEEKIIGSPLPGTLLGGRWFQEGDRNVCIVPLSMLQVAKSTGGSGDAGAANNSNGAATTTLGLTRQNALNQNIQVAGQTMRVIGIFDDSKWSGSTGLRDLDDEPFTPVDYQNQQNKQAATTTQSNNSKGQAPQVQSYQHMDATALLLIPYDTAMSLGATTRSVAAGLSGATAP
ncbi:MAG TPA: ABC transporter permease, partial [Abditibacteriaceae bacterium]|nr:ABC transporter permease [Abditibacteriaceae bacterium]